MKVYAVMRGRPWKIQSLHKIFATEELVQKYIDKIIELEIKSKKFTLHNEASLR